MTGQRVGNWILGGEIGRGTGGVVYKAHAADDPAREAAVKLLSHPTTSTPEFLARFPSEMLSLHRLNHPNVARFYDAGVQAGQAWYAAEFVPGTDCASLLKSKARRPDEPGLNWKDEVVALAVQAARALKHGHHRSLLHRDLKPSHFLVTPDGTLKLVDFGVAKFLHLPPLTLPPDPLGTAGFLAPEYYTGKPPTRRSDLYALGGVLYALTTGRAPFNATSPSEFLHKHCYTLPDRPVRFVPELPHELDDLICALLAKDPARRPATAAAVIEALDQVRGKLERKGKKVVWPADPGDTPAPADVEEVTADTDTERPRPLMSRPVVVVPMFALVVAVILAVVFWPRPSADDLYNAAVPLLASDDPADWDRAWDEYLEPLAERYPSQYETEVAAARARIGDRRDLKRAVDQGAKARYRSDPERLYQRGLRLAQAGDISSARRTWTDLIRAYADTPGADRWTELARVGLDELVHRPPVVVPLDRPALAAALDRVKALKAAGQAAEAAAKLAAFEDLYRNDPAALDLIREAR
ncbi:serine/threonine protein kinase [Fimbriiglobus ruber]|uniref:Serine/threonine protein kinase n=1 Tax=Fimbriiglobus ruber TaxID=1908690 RepID=A0A225D2N3_9BACT|nr:protein kinase [Fimbriiglobus ruber]OWK35850.1 serine/threonine protein kinase [Fimbriiglobus ruber]